MHTIIIGGGLAGLAAAKTLMQHGHTFKIIEKENHLGGRVQTSQINGHLIDHGFQVYLPGYEEGIHFFDYAKLDFQAFDPGSMILYDDGYHEVVSDPLRKPFTLFSTLLSKVGSFSDKRRLLNLKSAAKSFCKNPNGLKKNTSTYEFLVDFGFKQDMIHNFFIPFFSGVFFDKNLETSAEMFLYLYDKFSTCLASVPKNGMGELSHQLAAKMPSDSIHLGSEVISINKKSVQLSSGQNIIGDNIILAAPAEKLLAKLGQSKQATFNHSHTIYFESAETPHTKKLVGIVAKKNSLINNVSVMSNVSSKYAPSGKHQLAVSIFGEDYNSDIEAQIKKECQAWFGKQTEQWKMITRHHIRKALPKQKTVKFDLSKEESQIGENIFLAGDTMINGSINGALKSGRRAAEFAMEGQA